MNVGTEHVGYLLKTEKQDLDLIRLACYKGLHFMERRGVVSDSVSIYLLEKKAFGDKQIGLISLTGVPGAAPLCFGRKTIVGCEEWGIK